MKNEQNTRPLHTYDDMIEDLKISEDKTIFFTEDNLTTFIGQDQANIQEVHSYSIEDGEIVMCELDDEFYLVAHNFESDPRYFIYQVIDTGSQDDLEKSGYHFISEDEEFKEKIVISDDNKLAVYKHSDVGAIYSLESEDEIDAEISICEFTSPSNYLSHILIERVEHDRHDIDVTIYQGFELDEDDFELDED